MKLVIVLGFSILLLQFATLASVYAVKPLISVDPEDIPVDGTTNIHLETTNVGGPSDFLYYVVHQVKVICPSGDEYMLGNNIRPLNKWVPGYPNGLDIRVYLGDDKVIPFGTGVGGPINIDGTDYYWWRTKKAGASVYPNERVDLVPTPNPTGTSGLYEVDVEGWALYGTVGEPIRLSSWFNIPTHFEVPELALPIAIVMALGFVLVSFKSRRRELAKLVK